MGIKLAPRGHSDLSSRTNQKLVTDDERAEAAKLLDKMSSDAYGDGSKLFTPEQRKSIMTTAVRNTLKK